MFLGILQDRWSRDHLKINHLAGDHHTSFTIWLFNIAMENGPFIVDLPIKNSDFP